MTHGHPDRKAPPVAWRSVLRWSTVGALILFSGCTMPRDIEGTTSAIEERGVVRVGVIMSSGSLSGGDESPDGPEVDLVDGFARDLGLGIEWLPGTEQDLLTGLEEGSVDMVVGGITADNPWGARVAFSRPMFGNGEEAIVAALRNGENRWMFEWEDYLGP